MITDDNTLSDIEGTIMCIQIDLKKLDPEFPVDRQFAELLERIEDKLKKTRNKTRKNWFTTAHQHANNAVRCFENQDIEEADIHLKKCWEYLSQGNKAQSRKTAFIVGPDGEISQA